MSQKSRHRKWYEEHQDIAKARAKAHYEAHKIEKNTRLKELRRQLRLEVLHRYGGKCACCGETEPDFLAIDHVKNDGAEHRKKIGRGTSIYLWLRNNNYPDGFQVLCHNCNMAKQFYGVCPHQERK